MFLTKLIIKNNTFKLVNMNELNKNGTDNELIIQFKIIKGNIRNFLNYKIKKLFVFTVH